MRACSRRAPGGQGAGRGARDGWRDSAATQRYSRGARAPSPRTHAAMPHGRRGGGSIGAQTRRLVGGAGSDAQLGAAPVAALSVVADLVVGAEPNPVRDGSVLLRLLGLHKTSRTSACPSAPHATARHFMRLYERQGDARGGCCGEQRLQGELATGMRDARRRLLRPAGSAVPAQLDMRATTFRPAGLPLTSFTFTLNVFCDGMLATSECRPTRNVERGRNLAGRSHKTAGRRPQSQLHRS